MNSKPIIHTNTICAAAISAALIGMFIIVAPIASAQEQSETAPVTPGEVERTLREVDAYESRVAEVGSRGRRVLFAEPGEQFREAIARDAHTLIEQGQSLGERIDALIDRIDRNESRSIGDREVGSLVTVREGLLRLRLARLMLVEASLENDPLERRDTLVRVLEQTGAVGAISAWHEAERALLEGMAYALNGEHEAASTTLGIARQFERDPAMQGPVGRALQQDVSLARIKLAAQARGSDIAETVYRAARDSGRFTEAGEQLLVAETAAAATAFESPLVELSRSLTPEQIRTLWIPRVGEMYEHDGAIAQRDAAVRAAVGLRKLAQRQEAAISLLADATRHPITPGAIDAEARFALGFAFADRNELEPAWRTLVNAMDQHPADPRTDRAWSTAAWAATGWATGMAPPDADALTEAQAVVDRVPDEAALRVSAADMTARIALAHIALDSHDPETEQRLWRRAWRATHTLNTSESHAQLAAAVWLRGGLRLVELLSTDPDRARALARLVPIDETPQTDRRAVQAAAQTVLDQYARAIELASDLSPDPDTPAAVIAGFALARAGALADRIEPLRKGAALLGGTAAVWLDRLWNEIGVEASLGDDLFFDDAASINQSRAKAAERIAALATVRAEVSGRDAAWTQLARAHMLLGEWQPALHAADRADDHSDAASLAAEALLRLGDDERAFAAFRDISAAAAVEGDRWWHAWTRMLEILHAQGGRDDRVRVELRRLMDRGTFDPQSQAGKRLTALEAAITETNGGG